MTLAELLVEVEGATVTGTTDGTVTGLALDSRRVRPGDVFFALPGAQADGARFAAAAVSLGALAVVGARGVRVPGTTSIEVDDPRLALAQASCRFHAHPSRALEVVAVTGTNGKTTTTWLLESIWQTVGRRAGVVGTTGVRLDGTSRPSAFTTPEAPDLQSLLAQMRDHGVGSVALEASSHALAQRRTWGLACDVAMFTNLTQDHLDYHGTMAAYLDAKLMLFDGRNGPDRKRATAVVNADDAAAPRVEQAARQGGMRIVRFGEVAHADVRLERVAPAGQGLDVALVEGGRTHAFTLPLLGRYNAWNAAGAFAAALALGVPARDAVRGLQAAPTVPGRLERVDAGQSFLVVVDYAHTPDALERALAACREHATPGARVLAVFGCGGDRDRGKRPLMGAIAARLADRAWVTNDNPRSEDPQAIASEVVSAAVGDARSRLEVVLDRREAIAAALDVAGPGDVVLVAGKGHETTQTIGGRVLPFDDRVVARELLLELPGESA